MHHTIRRPIALISCMTALSCAPYATPEYQGEVLMAMHGTVTLAQSAAPAATTVSVVWLVPDYDAQQMGTLTEQVEVEANFPASYQIHFYEPPPAATLFEIDDARLAYGLIVNLDPNSSGTITQDEVRGLAPEHLVVYVEDAGSVPFFVGAAPGYNLLHLATDGPGRERNYDACVESFVTDCGACEMDADTCPACAVEGEWDACASCEDAANEACDACYDDADAACTTPETRAVFVDPASASVDLRFGDLTLEPLLQELQGGPTEVEELPGESTEVDCQAACGAAATDIEAYGNDQHPELPLCERDAILSATTNKACCEAIIDEFEFVLPLCEVDE